jgi:hypothetical protein
VELIEIKECNFETGFNRFCDLTRLEGICLSSAEVAELATRRRVSNPNDIRVNCFPGNRLPRVRDRPYVRRVLEFLSN